MQQEHKSSWKLVFKAAQKLREYAAFDASALDRMTVAQERLVGVIFGRPGGLMLKEIAQELGLTSGAVSQAIDVLVKEGLIERAPSPHDRRAVIIRPSEKCRVRREQTMEKFDRLVESVLRKATPAERDSFVTILQQIIDRTTDSRFASVRRSRRPEPALEEKA